MDPITLTEHTCTECAEVKHISLFVKKVIFDPVPKLVPSHICKDCWDKTRLNTSCEHRHDWY